MVTFRRPIATYRLQLNRSFGFEDARRLLPYLRTLGISDLYISPRFKARTGSSHGYDVADPQRVNPELGTEHDFARLVADLQKHRMGLLLDIVPNHMAASWENPWWMDVLEHGQSSPYAHFFDIDWTTSPGEDHKILLPVLGDAYATTLQNQELQLILDDGGLRVRYYDNLFPIDPGTYPLLLDPCIARLQTKPNVNLDALQALVSLKVSFEQLPPRSSSNRRSRGERYRLSNSIRARLIDVFQLHPEVREAFEETVRESNGERSQPESFARLDRLLSRQPYRLAFWRTALERINYRRFFDISHLVCLRVEDPSVFEARHAQILPLVRNESATGLRIDHVDGLYDPAGYLRRLQREMPASKGAAGQRFYVLVEKILGSGETLPRDWPVAGTTGYEFLNALNLLFLDRRGLRIIEADYRRFSGNTLSFADTVYACKKKVAHQLFRAEINSLVSYLADLSAHARPSSSLPSEKLAEVLIEITAALPIYRTYICGSHVSARDRAYIKQAFQRARFSLRRKRIRPAVWTFLRRTLLLAARPRERATKRLNFVQRWQQFSGPVMAKGLEDTASYIHNDLISLNEVGASPVRDFRALGPTAFDHFVRQHRRRWPYALNASATHDTKRGEDVRARINVLSELAPQWKKQLERWGELNHSKKTAVGGRLAPDANEEIHLYQTFLGAWPWDASQVPTFRERLHAFIIKAVREGKTNSSWLDPDVDYESALAKFIDAVLADSNQPFMTEFLNFQKQISLYALCNSLAQLAVKVAAPGAPDFYQGTELWDLSLVDPDNRRPVNFNQRIRLLETLQRRDAADRKELINDMLAHPEDGRLKLYLTWKALTFRQAHAELFLTGEYFSLKTMGKYRQHVFSFARRRGRTFILAVVPRLPTKLAPPTKFPLGEEVWANTTVHLPRAAPTHWHNFFTGERHVATTQGRTRTLALALASLFKSLPVALLKGSLR